MQPGKEYPVADPAGFGGSPKHDHTVSRGGTGDLVAVVPATLASSTQTHVNDSRVLDRGEQHEVLKVRTIQLQRIVKHS